MKMPFGHTPYPYLFLLFLLIAMALVLRFVVWRNV